VPVHRDVTACAPRQLQAVPHRNRGLNGSCTVWSAVRKGQLEVCLGQQLHICGKALAQTAQQDLEPCQVMHRTVWAGAPKVKPQI
jgi:hypothetical protein